MDDLPDEILLMIFKQLSNVEVLYSLTDVNQRLNQIVCHPVFTSYLNFSNRFSNNSPSPLTISMLDRFYFDIFPKIYDQIQWLAFAASFIDHILLFPKFPNLYGLGLSDLEIEYAKYLFIDLIIDEFYLDETSLIQKLKNQLTSLFIDITQNASENSMKDAIELVFTHILAKFINLKYLNIYSYSIAYKQIAIETSTLPVISSPLLELHICLDDINDCLCLFDGRFNHLHTLFVKMCFISSSPLITNIKKNLVKLKRFSLHCDNYTKAYDTSVVPLLQRMSNLEELNFHLLIEGNQRLVDGNELERNIVNHMPLLKKFTFDIRSSMRPSNENRLPSNEYIQSTFKNFSTNKILSYIDTFSNGEIGKCHFYTCPYQLNYYDEISNHFPGGLFKYVQNISLYDECPFEHEFFLRIEQSFPVLKKLTLHNSRAQKNKLFNQSVSIIKYSHLIILDLFEAHDDYLEEFLLDTKTYLMNNIELRVDYRSLKRVTHSFTRRGTRINCSKMLFPYENYLTQFPKHFKAYFDLQK